MATPTVEIDEILLTLAESPLRVIAAEARDAVSDLPRTETATADGRYGAVLEQIRVVRETVVGPLKRELDALAHLPELALALGLSPHVMVRVSGSEGRSSTVELTSKARMKALNAFVGSLSKALDDAGKAAYRRIFQGLT